MSQSRVVTASVVALLIIASGACSKDTPTSPTANSDVYFVAGSAEGVEKPGGGTGITLDSGICFKLPTAVYEITGYYFGENVGAGTFHAGDDVHAPAGTAIYSIAAGTVRFAGQAGTWGYLVEVNYTAPDGTSFIGVYGHNGNSLKVKAGDHVIAGAQLGVTGTQAENGGWPPHLHFGVFVGTHPATGVLKGHVSPAELLDYRDPTVFLNAHGHGSCS